MAYFDSDGVQIYYEEHGSGAPAILVHGFASRADHNWGEAWFSALAAKYRVIALDCRGHGKSGKPHDSQAYAGDTMGDDVIRMMDHLGISRTLLMGYSMGGRISLGLLRSHPERLRAVVLGGIGAAAASEGSALARNRKPIVEALLADDASKVAAETPRQFRQFAAAVGNDLKALAACMGAERADLTAEDIAARPIKVPVLIAIGTKDLLVGDPNRLQKAIPGSQLVMIEGRDHLSAPGDERFRAAVLKFFASAPA